MTHGDRNAPPILKQARELQRKVHLAVMRMPRAHKYDVGIELRHDARAVNRAAVAAWRDRARQLDRVLALSTAVDDFKLTMQLAQDVPAFGSFGEFEDIARNASSLGRQVGGWLKKLHPSGQNQAADRPAGRAQILSSRAASCAEAHP
jgi:hypothetical protein